MKPLPQSEDFSSSGSEKLKGKITSVQLEKTFRTNIFSYFYLTRAALPSNGGTIVNG